jgi:hypothetical protein
MTRRDDTACLVISAFLWCGVIALICWLKEVL